MIAAGVFLMLASCARSQSASSAAEGSSSAVVLAPVITLERTACFGGCPVYTISVSPAGEVQYEGRAHVKKVGTATGKISPERVDGLLSELERGGYFTFADRYASAGAGLRPLATDSPTTITSVTLRGRTKQITHDYGCGAVPGALTVLERRIDEALNSGQWTGR